jgi:hypothetical protein
MLQTDNQIELSKPQTRVWRTRSALNLDMAGQRAGKSQMIGIISGFYIQAYPSMKGFIGANTYMQLIQSTLVKTTEIWRDLYGYTPYSAKHNPFGHYVVDKKPPEHWIRYEEYKDYHNIISFWNGTTIFVGSLDNFKAHEGKEFAWAHLDETKDTREEAVTTVILARLSQRGLYINPKNNQIVYHEPHTAPEYYLPFNPTWIHTSPAIGQVDWLVDMFDLDKYEPEIRQAITRQKPDGTYDFYHREAGGKNVVIFSTYHNLKNLPSNYIEQRKSILSENEQLKFIYGYPFSKTGGEYYPAFARVRHVAPVQFNSAIPTIHITWDFNVMPYLTCLAAQTEYYVLPSGGEMLRIYIYREYCYSNPLNTIEAVCSRILADHPSGTAIFYYGDASGKNRIPGLGSLTSYRQIEMYLAPMLHNGSDRVGRKNINPLKRRDLVSKIFEGKANVEIVIDPSCKETIRDLEYLKLAADGKLKEKERDAQTGAVFEKIGHTSDALEYMLCELCKDLFTEDV